MQITYANGNNMNRTDWVEKGKAHVREFAMYIAGARNMNHDEALAYADLCERKYLQGVRKIEADIKNSRIKG